MTSSARDRGESRAKAGGGGATQPLVSIVTPSLNQAEFIEQTILSVRDQDYPNIEHIVIDGGSSDGTLAILKKYPHLVWLSEPDDGQSSAINKGFKRTKGDIVAWLNSDDVYLPGAVSAAVAFLGAHPETFLVYGDYREIDSCGVVTGVVRARDFDFDYELNVRNVLPQPSVFFRRGVFERVGCLSEKYHYAFDVEYWIRIAHAGLQIDHAPLLWSSFRRHDLSKTTVAPNQFWREDRAIRRLYGGRFFSRAFFMYYRNLINQSVYRGMKHFRLLRPLALLIRQYLKKET
jgi:glycosyltransferase involved in cell wall biosynthesis